MFWLHNNVWNNKNDIAPLRKEGPAYSALVCLCFPGQEQREENVPRVHQLVLCNKMNGWFLACKGSPCSCLVRAHLLSRSWVLPAASQHKYSTLQLLWVQVTNRGHSWSTLQLNLPSGFTSLVKQHLQSKLDPAETNHNVSYSAPEAFSTWKLQLLNALHYWPWMPGHSWTLLRNIRTISFNIDFHLCSNRPCETLTQIKTKSKNPNTHFLFSRSQDCAALPNCCWIFSLERLSSEAW